MVSRTSPFGSSRIRICFPAFRDTPRLRYRLGGLCLLLLSSAVSAIDRVQLDLGVIENSEWKLTDARLSVDWSSPGQSVLNVEIPRIDVGNRTINELTLVCDTFEWLQNEISCQRGLLSFSSPWVNADAIPATFSYKPDSGQLGLSISDLPLATGRLGLSVRYRKDDWTTGVSLKRMELAALAKVADENGWPLPGLAVQGKVDGRVELHGNNKGLNRAVWQLSALDSGYSNDAGTQAAEELQLGSSGQADYRVNSWLIDTKLSVSQGMLYSDPVYLEFSKDRPVQLDARIKWNPQSKRIQLTSMDVNQPGVLVGTLQALFQPDSDVPLQSLDVHIKQSWLPGFYESWIQPWLAGTALERLETRGSLQGEFYLADGEPQSLQLALDDVSLQEPEGLFGIQGLNAGLEWSNDDSTYRSSLAWQSANVYRLTLGAVSVPLETGRRHLKLLEPVMTGFLDGQLQVEEFELGVNDEKGLHWLLDGLVTPVSMRTFSTAVGWMPLSGKLSGMVPRMRYEDGVLTLGGILLVQVFDGDVTVRNLRIEKPLGIVPRLWADTRLDGIDLKTLTRTFSFGRIEGRVNGAIDNLYMEAWQPVAFDARIETPEDDRSRHRISQKAVDNISNLGGAGMGGVMSRGFLRFFEDFRYQRLGISCRLENSVCHMEGVEPAADGFYLVKGSLLPPRLDVIGHNSEVDWSSLLERLINITHGEGPRIE